MVKSKANVVHWKNDRLAYVRSNLMTLVFRGIQLLVLQNSNILEFAADEIRFVKDELFSWKY